MMMSMKRPPKYVHGFVDRHGHARYYFRRAGFKSIALPGLPWSPEFMAAYEAAIDGKTLERIEVGSRRTQPGTINALVVAYFKSDDFTNLADETQRARRRIIELFRNEHGHKAVALMQKKHVEGILATIERRHAKRNWFKTIRGLLAYAVTIHMRDDDPTDGIKYAKSPKTDGRHTWTDDEIKRYRYHWPLGTQQRLAMELALETTSRRSDVARIGPQHEQDGRLHLRHTKNRSNTIIPISPELRAAIDACPTKHLTFLHTKAGAPRSGKALGGDFRQWCDSAGLPKRCSIHGLRKGGARRLAEAGATPHEIMAVTGHKTLSEVERYTRAVEQRGLADRAFKKLSESGS